jgi:hypothetical protein
VFLRNKAKEKKSMHTKFKSPWIGPYIIEKVLGFNSYILQDIKGKRLMLPINEKHLKGFFTQNFLIFLVHKFIFKFVYSYL